MEEKNKNKKYRIHSVDYEWALHSDAINNDSYTYWEIESIVDFMTDWYCCDFDKTDAYDYVDDIEELVPPELTDSDRKRFIEYLNKYIEKMN
ncbi:hypothetical protein [Ligilactobacillus hayakitensis]|uniref:hypothetical protein n=1 Tax=Ligilactobacillus hayakitensis TaxID=396716 RepID=UPI00046AB09A|nr:hypothetical protein [Ligilactobacillus hayakitensis]